MESGTENCEHPVRADRLPRQARIGVRRCPVRRGTGPRPDAVTDTDSRHRRQAIARPRRHAWPRPESGPPHRREDSQQRQGGAVRPSCRLRLRSHRRMDNERRPARWPRRPRCMEDLPSGDAHGSSHVGTVPHAVRRHHRRTVLHARGSHVHLRPGVRHGGPRNPADSPGCPGDARRTHACGDCAGERDSPVSGRRAGGRHFLGRHRGGMARVFPRSQDR